MANATAEQARPPRARDRHYFAGKTALVTGAGSGIGAALVQALYECGAHVIASDRDRDAVEAVAVRARDVGAARQGDHWVTGSVESVALDVTDADGFSALVAAIDADHDGIDVLFNNAGVGLAGALHDTSLDDWRRVMDVNVFGVVNGIHAAYPLMLARGRGQIVNTGSGAGLVPRPGMVPYAASKHAVVGLSTSLRVEAAAHGVRVNVVCPGFIATDIQRRTVYRNLDHEALLAEVPIKPMSARDCAMEILRGARRDRPVIPVTSLTRVEWLLYRIAPGLVGRVIVKRRARAFAAHRQAAASAAG